MKCKCTICTSVTAADVKKWGGFVTWCVKRFCARNTRFEGMRDDLIQEAWLAFYDAKDLYDSSLGAFSTFLAAKIYWRLRTYGPANKCDLRFKGKSRELFLKMEGEEAIPDSTDPHLLPDDLVLARELMERLENWVSDSKNGRVFLERFFNPNVLQGDIAKRFGVRPSAISRAEKIGRRLFEDFAREIREETTE